MKIVLFFTELVSVKMWHEQGLLSREMAIYERLCDRGHSVAFVTYGNEHDAEYMPSNSPIQVLSRPPEMDYRNYSWGMHRIHAAALTDADVFISNQIIGARFAVYAKWRLKKPYVARVGYLQSYILQQQGAALQQRGRNWVEEALAFHSADVVQVSTQTIAQQIAKRYRVRRDKLTVLANYIDTETFKPKQQEKTPRYHLCYVGRFHVDKGIMLMLEVMRSLPDDLRAVLIGHGPQLAEIQAYIEAYDLSVEIIERVLNHEIPAYLADSLIYMQPTRYEGNPKTILEAMACGLPVISSDVLGVNDVITHDVDGWLCPVDDVDAFRVAVGRLLKDASLRVKLGQAARAKIVAEFSLDAAVEKQSAILERVAH